MPERITVFKQTENNIRSRVEYIDRQLQTNTNDLKSLDTDGDMTDDPILHTLKSGREGLMEEKLKLQSLQGLGMNFIEETDVANTEKIQRGHLIRLQIVHPDKYHDEFEITIGSKIDSDFLNKLGVISDEAPLGRALLGKKEGDEVEYQTPSGVGHASVIKISVSPLIKT